MVNHPPKGGLKSVEVFYQGDLDDLGDNLKNALQNTFVQIEKLSFIKGVNNVPRTSWFGGAHAQDENQKKNRTRIGRMRRINTDVF